MKDKGLISNNKRREPGNAEHNNVVNRPWGNYVLITKSQNYLIKKIAILPKQSISLQLHNHRSEHWIILSGVAHIMIGKNKLILKESQSTFVPKKTKHKITNRGAEPLIILETQLGSILSEQDITRFDDQYNRA
jgi:mannose-6-phosphate isomerase-like protein (cupin superfamily)